MTYSMRQMIVGLAVPLLAACPAEDSDMDDSAATSVASGDGDGDTGEDTDPSAGDGAPSTSTTGSDSGSGTEGESGSSSGTDTGEVVEGCECIPMDEGSIDVPVQPSDPTCGDALCPAVHATCPPNEICDGSTVEVDDLDALECALTALRDRTPGIVRWSQLLDEGVTTTGGYILILEDGRAVRREWTDADLTHSVSDAELGVLADTQEYDACLASTDLLARFDCVGGPLDSLDAVCNEGWTYDEL